MHKSVPINLKIKNKFRKYIKDEKIKYTAILTIKDIYPFINKRIIEFDNVKIDLSKLLIIRNENEFKINNTEKILEDYLLENADIEGIIE